MNNVEFMTYVWQRLFVVSQYSFILHGQNSMKYGLRKLNVNQIVC